MKSAFYKRRRKKNCPVNQYHAKCVLNKKKTRELLLVVNFVLLVSGKHCYPQVTRKYSRYKVLMFVNGSVVATCLPHNTGH